jgi:hypothetical protein
MQLLAAERLCPLWITFSVLTLSNGEWCGRTADCSAHGVRYILIFYKACPCSNCITEQHM